jgi:hypothetical protein
MSRFWSAARGVRAGEDMLTPRLPRMRGRRRSPNMTGVKVTEGEAEGFDLFYVHRADGNYLGVVGRLRGAHGPAWEAIPVKSISPYELMEESPRELTGFYYKDTAVSELVEWCRWRRPRGYVMRVRNWSP